MAFNNQLHQTLEGSLLDMKNHGGAGELAVEAVEKVPENNMPQK